MIPGRVRAPRVSAALALAGGAAFALAGGVAPLPGMAGALALAPVLATGTTAPAPAPAGAGGARRGLEATRILVARLGAAGRGEASVRVTLSDPLGGPDRVQAGRLALEPPDRVRLDFPGTGERLAVRGDGGEWVQPAVRQMLRLGPEHAGLAAWLWEMFLRAEASEFRERVPETGRHVLEPRDPGRALPERIGMRLDRRGLPSRVEYTEPGGATVRYEFTGWRFGPPRGAAAFALRAPSGYAVVDLP